MFNRSPILAVSALAVVLSSGAIAGEGMSGYKDTAKDNAATFSKLDTDNNGMLSSQEARAKASGTAHTEQLTKKWTELDTNQDGQLDQAEFARFEPADAARAGEMDNTNRNTDSGTYKMDSADDRVKGADPEDKMHNYGEDTDQQ